MCLEDLEEQQGQFRIRMLISKNSMINNFPVVIWSKIAAELLSFKSQYKCYSLFYLAGTGGVAIGVAIGDASVRNFYLMRTKGLSKLQQCALRCITIRVASVHTECALE